MRRAAWLAAAAAAALTTAASQDDCDSLAQRCSACTDCLDKSKRGWLSNGEDFCAQQPACCPGHMQCNGTSTCDPDAMQACGDLLEVRGLICYTQTGKPCPCVLSGSRDGQRAVPHGFWQADNKRCYGPKALWGGAVHRCSQGNEDQAVAKVPWKSSVKLVCEDGWQIEGDENAVCTNTGNTTMLTQAGRPFSGSCKETRENKPEFWLARGGAAFSFLASGWLVQLYFSRTEIRRSAVELEHLIYLALTLCASALATEWGAIKPGDCAFQGPVALATSLSTLVHSLGLNIFIYRTSRSHARGAARRPRSVLSKCASILCGWALPVALGVAAALGWLLPDTDPDERWCADQCSDQLDEPFTCALNRRSGSAWLVLDLPALVVYSISVALACQMLCSWYGCRCGAGAGGGALQSSLLDNRDGKRDGALIELEQGSRRASDLAGRQLWMLLSFVLCWAPRTVLTLVALFDDASGRDADAQPSEPSTAISVLQWLHALLWPLQGVLLLLAFTRVRNSGVLQEKGTYEELMARIGYARQEAASSGSSALSSSPSPRGGGATPDPLRRSASEAPL